MSIGVYIHIPYCLQRCHYCDFATFEWKSILPPEEYTHSLIREIVNRQHLFPKNDLKSIYFGGGTPSLIPSEHIVAVLRELANAGFKIRPETEVTIEINPATVNAKKLSSYLDAGINRFSVGAQTFNDDLLKLCGREHSSKDTIETLTLLNEKELNYSFDLLFALPGQSLEMLNIDLDLVDRFKPPHLSTYCLTVPSGHKMASNRPSEKHQIKMFQTIEERANSLGLLKYEISNFARPSFESVHNNIYWSDSSYWGLGLGAHSYINNINNGFRFWNPTSIDAYVCQAQKALPQSINIQEFLPKNQFEELKLHESLTDYCHIHLRTKCGIQKRALHQKYGEVLALKVQERLNSLLQKGLLDAHPQFWCLNSQGQMLSNQVFSALTFLESDLAT